jgi:hypothetical protein
MSARPGWSMSEELRIAQRDQWRLDDLGENMLERLHPGVDLVALREACAERDAIRAEGVAAGAAVGLVSIPTSGRSHARASVHPFRVLAQTAAVAEAVGGFEPDPEASRFARLRMKVGAAARWMLGHPVGVERVWLVTLTYAGTNADWQPRHVSDAIKAHRAWCREQGHPCRYVWVAELQKRGVIHYHLAIWLPAGVVCPKWDACGWWPHGMTNRVEAQHAVGYLMSYLSKGDKATRDGLPKGARAHGRGGLGEGRAFMRWLSYPTWIQERAQWWERWSRSEGGGWEAPSGERFRSEFARTWIGHAWHLVRVCAHDRLGLARPTVGESWPNVGPWSAWSPS